MPQVRLRAKIVYTPYPRPFRTRRFVAFDIEISEITFARFLVFSISRFCWFLALHDSGRLELNRYDEPLPLLLNTGIRHFQLTSE